MTDTDSKMEFCDGARNNTITDVTARGVPLQVVAVKWPGHWIIRAMRCMAPLEEVVKMIQPYIASAPPDELEWTHHRYEFPGYVVYGSGDLLGLNELRHEGYNWPVPPNGVVYLFPFNGGADTYRGPARRLDA